MQKYKYLAGYGNELLKQVDHLIEHKKLSSYFQKKYKKAHDFSSDRALYDYTLSLKDQYLRKSNPLSKVIYDNKINVMKHALGLHTFISRVQGKKLKAKHEIRIASIFKNAPEPFLKMIVVHELAHLKRSTIQWHTTPIRNNVGKIISISFRVRVTPLHHLTVAKVASTPKWSEE